MLPRRVLPLALLPLLTALALTACADERLSADELRVQASVICARTAAATDRVAVPSTPDQGGRFLEQGLAHLRPAVARLRALKPPEELADRYERAVQLAGQEVALIARHERAIAGGDDVIDTFRRLQTGIEPLTRQENAYWRALMIPDCVRR